MFSDRCIEVCFGISRRSIIVLPVFVGLFAELFKDDAVSDKLLSDSEDVTYIVILVVSLGSRPLTFSISTQNS